MFETEANGMEERPRSSGAAKFAAGFAAGVSTVLLPPALALVFQGGETQLVFPPAPYFLLALGVGLFIGLAMLVIVKRSS